MISSFLDELRQLSPFDRVRPSTPTFAEYLSRPPHADRLEGGNQVPPNEKSAPRVTVVMPVYNAAPFILDALESVFRQSYQAIEIIVVDGGSTDATLEAVRSVQSRLTRWISEPDLGMYDAINKGIALASGKYVKILNADDRLTPDSVATAVGVLESNPGAWVRSDILVIDRNGKQTGERWSERDLSCTFRRGDTPSLHPSWFVPLEVYRRLGLYSREFRVSSDWDYYIRLQREAVPRVHTETPLMEFREGGISANMAVRIEGFTITRFHYGWRSAMYMYVRQQLVRQRAIVSERILGRKNANRIRLLVREYIR
jgi:glycosyltransferase involved in cell wall biosynthesis